MKRTQLALLVFAGGLVAGGGIGYGVARWRARVDTRPVATAQVFNHVLSAIRTSFVDSLTDEELYVKAAKGVVTTLGDPYSSFLGPEEFRGYRDMLRGRGETFGFTMETGLTGLRIASVVKGSAADRAGLAPGNFVIDIDGSPAADWSPARAVAALKVDSSGAVAIRIRNVGDSVPVETRIAPETGRLPAVGSVVRLSDSVGYFALRSVSDKASDEVLDALNALRAWELSSLVIDLRGNLGGRLEEALSIADIFLSPGQRIGTVAKRRLKWGYSASSRPEVYPHVRLTLLVDRKTASSAEIIAAALRDNDRARLVGERTFGKGLIQTTIPLGDSIAVRLTTGRWQGPGGELIAGGLLPDSVVALTPWETTLRRSLAARLPVVSSLLAEIAARHLAEQVRPDSVVLDRIDQDLIRTRLRESGLTLSRRSVALHQDMFRREVARLVAASSGDSRTAIRFSLLTDPVVTAGVAMLSRPVPQLDAAGR